MLHRIYNFFPEEKIVIPLVSENNSGCFGLSLEKKLGIKVNNSQDPDLCDSRGRWWELKGKNRKSTAKTTMFHFDPDESQDIMTLVRGPRLNNVRRLCSGITQKPNNLGLKSTISSYGVHICRNDEIIATWERDKLKSKIEKKFSQVILIDGTVDKLRKTITCERYWKLMDIDFELFLYGLRVGIIIIELDQHDGNKCGVRNHGVKFRTSWNNLIF